MGSSIESEHRAPFGVQTGHPSRKIRGLGYSMKAKGAGSEGFAGGFWAGETGESKSKVIQKSCNFVTLNTLYM